MFPPPVSPSRIGRPAGPTQVRWLRPRAVSADARCVARPQEPAPVDRPRRGDISPGGLDDSPRTRLSPPGPVSDWPAVVTALPLRHALAASEKTPPPPGLGTTSMSFPSAWHRPRGVPTGSRFWHRENQALERRDPCAVAVDRPTHTVRSTACPD